MHFLIGLYTKRDINLTRYAFKKKQSDLNSVPNNVSSNWITAFHYRETDKGTKVQLNKMQHSSSRLSGALRTRSPMFPTRGILSDATFKGTLDAQRAVRFDKNRFDSDIGNYSWITSPTSESADVTAAILDPFVRRQEIIRKKLAVCAVML